MKSQSMAADIGQKFVMKILVVSEELILLKALGDFLKDLGHDVTGESSAARLEEPEHQDASPMDLILVDTEAPKGKSSRIINRIHKLYPDADIIVISSTGANNPLSYSVSHRIFSYMKKPVRLADLELLITRVMERRAGATIDPDGQAREIE